MFAFVLTATLPGVYQPFRPGLDPSWQWAINSLPNVATEYGRDVVHPYGPLGFLLVTGELGANVPIAFGFWLAVQAAAGAVFWRFRRHYGALPSCLFAITFLAGASTGLWAEYHLVAVASLCFLAALLPERGSSAFAPVGGILFALLAFVKWSVAFWAVPETILFCLICVLSRPRLWRVAACALAGFILAGALLGSRFFQSLSDILTALRLGLDASSEISVAMSMAGPDAVVVLALLSLAALAFAFRPPFLRPTLSALFILVPVLLAFKHGFSRQDGHVTAFFGLAAAMSAFPFLLWNRSRERRTTAVVVATICVGFSLLCGTRYDSLPPLTMGRYWHNLSAGAGLEKLAWMGHFAAFRAELLRESQRNLEVSRLPESWTRRIAAEGGRVDSLPSEISLIPANNLSWEPNPALQLFTAYTNRLDTLVAHHFSSERRPKLLIVKDGAVDGRWMLFDTPSTWRAILARYEVIEADARNERLMLRDSGAVRAGEPVEVGRQTIRFGEEVPVPRTPDLLYAALQFRRTLRGEVEKLVYRVPPIRVEILTERRRRLIVRLVPSTAGNGLLLHPFASDFESLRQLFSNLEGEGVASFRLTQDGPGCYEPAVTCVWQQARGNSLPSTHPTSLQDHQIDAGSHRRGRIAATARKTFAERLRFPLLIY